MNFKLTKGKIIWSIIIGLILIIIYSYLTFQCYGATTCSFGINDFIALFLEGVGGWIYLIISIIIIYLVWSLFQKNN